MPKLHWSFSPLSALHLHLPHQGICHPVLDERPHPYFVRFDLLTALWNVTGPLALSTTSKRNDFNPSHKDNGYYTHRTSNSNTAQLFTHIIYCCISIIKGNISPDFTKWMTFVTEMLFFLGSITRLLKYYFIIPQSMPSIPTFLFGFFQLRFCMHFISDYTWHTFLTFKFF